MITGGCLCGQVRYAVDAAPIAMALCHCRDCQRVTGSAFVGVMMVPGKAFRLTGEVRRFAWPGESGRHAVRNSCPVCASNVFGAPEVIGDAVNLYAGTLDDPSLFKPGIAIFKRSRLGWDIPETPGFDGAPQGAPPV